MILTDTLWEKLGELQAEAKGSILELIDDITDGTNETIYKSDYEDVDNYSIYLEDSDGFKTITCCITSVSLENGNIKFSAEDIESCEEYDNQEPETFEDYMAILELLECIRRSQLSTLK